MEGLPARIGEGRVDLWSWPTLATMQGGGALAAWTDDQAAADEPDIHLRLLGDDGAPVGEGVGIHAVEPSTGVFAAGLHDLIALPSGKAIVTWWEDDEGGAATLRAQIVTTHDDPSVIADGRRPDDLRGGRGQDVIVGLGGDDTARGRGGSDDIHGGGGDDRLGGGGGRDRIHGGEGTDKINGNSGRDALWGGARKDRLYGGRGDDRLEGGEGRDRLEGGAGDDVILWGNGADRAGGGAGADRFELRGEVDWSGEAAGRRLRIMDFEAGIDTVVVDRGLAGWPDAEDVVEEQGRMRGDDFVLRFRDGTVIRFDGVTDVGAVADALVIV